MSNYMISTETGYSLGYRCMWWRWELPGDERFWPVGTWHVAFSCAGLPPSNFPAVVDDFGTLVQVPA